MRLVCENHPTKAWPEECDCGPGMKEPMKRCMDCGDEYEPLSRGGILPHICEPCQKRNAERPEPWVKRKGLFIPNEGTE